MKKEDFKKWWNKFYFTVWKDDSFKGWIISIIFLFILIKFIFFPTLSLVTGTTLPLAIVESCSMYHSGNLLSNNANWWENHKTKYSNFDLTQEAFKNFIFQNGFNKGDMLFIIGANTNKLKVGDVVIFNAGRAHPIIHRIIAINETEDKKTFSTIGDNNNGQLSIEKNIQENQIVGKAVFKVAPYLGWIKLIFFEGLKAPQEKGFCKEN